MVCGPRFHRGLVLAALAVLSGCAESVYLNSRPSGALVSINGQPVGRTPMVYSVLPAKWDPPYRYRLERPGYAPAEGVLATGASDGRVIGGILTLGLSLFFKQPETFLEEAYLVDLERTSSTPVPRGAPTAPSRTFRPVPQPPPVPYEPPAPLPESFREPPARERVAPPPPPRPTPRPVETRRPPTAVPTARPAPTASAPPPVPLEPPVPAPIRDAAEEGVSTDVQKELERLRQLRDDGVIVDAEYQQLRDSLLKGQ